MPQVMPWEEYSSTPSSGGQGVVIQPTMTPQQAAAEARAQSAEARANEAAARERLRFEKEMTGAGRKPLREGDAQKLTDDVSSVEAIERALNSFQDDYVGLTADIENMAQGVAGFGTPGQRDWWADFRATDNQIRNALFGASLTAGEKSAYASTTITPRMAPEEVRRNLERRLEIARKAASRRFDRLNAAGYNPDEVAAIVGEVDIKTPIEQRKQQASPQPLGLEAGATFSTEQDKAIAAAVQQAWQAGGGVQELAAAAEAAGGVVTPNDIASFQQAVEARANKQAVTFTPAQTGQRSPIAQAAGEALMTPAGTALTGAVNAAGAGLLSQVAGDQVQGLEALNPNAALVGELGGAMLGTAGLAGGTSAALRMTAPGIAERVAGGGLAGAIGREVLTEGTYGGLYAANTGQDIGTGIGLGAAGSLGGRAAGAAARRVAPAVGRMLGRDGIPPDGGAGGGVPPAGGTPMDGAPTGGASMTGGIDQMAVQAEDEAFIPRTVRFNDAGAAGTPEDVIRAERAKELPVPVELARFQRSRLFEEQQRARELAKNSAVGGPIRERLAEQQNALRQNFDRFIDETGSEVWENAREKGIVVDQALKKLADVGKARIRVLYKRAEKAGETAEPVPYTNVKAFIEEQDVTTREKLAPVLDAVNNQLSKADPDGTGSIPINDLESIRKFINKTVGNDAGANGAYGKELKDLIDAATENVGGNLYKQAREARIQYAKTFENAGLVKKLMGTKPGTVDRQVALEKVAEKAIYSGETALDDIKALKSVLDQASTRGQRAWRELQGATMEHIRDQAYKGVTRDESGQAVISPANLDRVVTQLDRAGKLDFVFGRRTADLIRTINEVAKDVVTAPPGSVNASNTSSAALNAIDTLTTFGFSGLPVPGGAVLKSIREGLRNRELRKEVKRLLD